MTRTLEIHPAAVAEIQLARFPRFLKVGALLLGAAGLATHMFCARITLLNESAIALENVEISGRGFSRSVAQLEPRHSHTFWFVPGGDTDAKIAFRANGREIDAGSHGYFTAPPHPQVSRSFAIDSDLRVRSTR